MITLDQAENPNVDLIRVDFHERALNSKHQALPRAVHDRR